MASLEYTDAVPDDLTSLAKKFDPDAVANYEEILGAESKKQLKVAQEEINNYSLENDLIPQVIKLCAKDSFIAAKKILNIADNGDTVLYLGRSPSILLTSSEFLAPSLDKEAVRHIQVNFSGTPNIKNPRNHGVDDLRNVVTEERLLHFCKYLDEKGLGNLTTHDQLYITDIVGKGAGMNAFLRILIYYYVTCKELEETPKITLLLMNFDEKRSHLEKNCYFYNPQTCDFIFSNASSTHGAYRGMRVKALPLGMSEAEGGVLDALDTDLVQDYLLSGREYPAFYWSKAHDIYRNSNPELANAFNGKLRGALEGYSDL